MTDSAQTMTRRCQWCREICRGECGCDAEKRIAALEADIEKRRKWNTELALANDRLEAQCREEIRLRSEAVARAIAAEQRAAGRLTMTDLEITRRCAEAMGFKPRYFRLPNGDERIEYAVSRGWAAYDPLHDKAQAFELVEMLNLCVDKVREEANPRSAVHAFGNWDSMVYDHDLKRAVCLCVAGTKQP